MTIEKTFIERPSNAARVLKTGDFFWNYNQAQVPWKWDPLSNLYKTISLSQKEWYGLHLQINPFA
jgi:hypothetical protein